jgi:hypothetical protein
MKIRTQFKSNAHGAGQIVATSGGRQKTTNTDLSKSSDWNHGTAAGALLLAIPAHPFNTALVVKGFDALSHDSNDSGTVHTFSL